MTAVWMWVRVDARRRWRSWVVLGVLAGVSVGLACAGVAGARRTENAIPTYARAINLPDAAVLANDPEFDDAQRAKVAALPEVDETYPFLVPFLLDVQGEERLDAPLLPTEPQSSKVSYGIVVDGRLPNPARADEIVVNENVRDQFGFDLDDTLTLTQTPPDPSFPFPVPPNAARPINQELRVVGITRAEGDDINLSPSSGFYEKYESQLVGSINEFVKLRGGDDDFVRFQADVQRITGKPTNVERVEDLFGIRKLRRVAEVERNGLLLFALAVLLGAGVLVGQALVRAVTAGAVDIATWRALGADRQIALRSMVAPAGIAAVVGAITTFIVAVALSPRFPVAILREFDLDIGVHVDWPVLLAGMVALVVAVMLTAWVSAFLRIRPGEVSRARTPSIARSNAVAGLPPPLLIGSLLAIEPGSGRRAVPVRSALVGAIVGVVGVVGCLTFGRGLSDVVQDPRRAGVVWDYGLASTGVIPAETVNEVVSAAPVASAVHATWARAVLINGVSTPTFGTERVLGDLEFVVLAGRAPRTPDELAVAPVTMDSLDLRVGEVVTVGDNPARKVRVVGRALLPSTSHTDYDQSAWMTADGMRASLPPGSFENGDFTEDYLLMRWTPEADARAAEKRADTFLPPEEITEGQRAALPAAVRALRDLRALPTVLALFFALLAIATVAHALVTTVRRRRGDLAVLRSIGFTRRDARVAIAWQATVIALVGLVVGVPLGVIVGRFAWKQLANSFPFVYVPPLALLAVLVVIPIAIAVANAVAAGPAHAATRIRPATVLRSE